MRYETGPYSVNFLYIVKIPFVFITLMLEYRNLRSVGPSDFYMRIVKENELTYTKMLIELLTSTILISKKF